MKFLIFGGTGFVGRNLSSYIKDRGGEVTSISRSGGGDSLVLDISNEAEFSKLQVRPDVIINCASKLPSKGKVSTDPAFLEELFLTNVVGSANIVNWAVKNKIPKIINCSTLVVVKKPWPEPLKEDHVALPDGSHVGYAMSKLSQEQIMNHGANEGDTRLLHLRLSAVYGEGMTSEGIIFRLLERLSKDQDINLTDAGKNTLDLIHVQDVCRVIFAVSKTPFENGIMNVAKGEKVSILQLAEILKEITGAKSDIRDEVTSNLPSNSEIEVEIMKKAIGEEYRNFLDLKKGLAGIVENYKD